jgi:glycosyltransferase involved in cell wall biosynthesis
MQHRVTLALPVFNGEKYLSEAIVSILRQEYTDFELIITDNASTDGTERICRDFAAGDQRIRYIRNDRNLGAGPNFNMGFELSTGEYFKWCACDDRISANFIGDCVAALDRNPKVVLAYGVTQCIDQDGRPIPMFGGMMPKLTGTPAQRFRQVVSQKGTCFEIFGVFRRSELGRTTLQQPYYGTDFGILAEMSLLGEFIEVPDIVFFNREHPTRSINLGKSDRIKWQCTDVANKHSREHLTLLNHLFEICMRRSDVASPVRTVAALAPWASSPLQLSRYGLELIGMLSPAAQGWLRENGWRLLQTLKQSSDSTR